jgi:tetraacyldisaccharide 4'-kinase
MPEYLWRSDESHARRVALAPLLLLEGPYRLGAWLHRRVYDAGWRRTVRLDPAVVSVGNLSVGGSGKTPLVGWLASELRARRYRVAILSRGVGGRREREVSVVSDGERVLLSPADVGDEPVLLAGRARGVPVFAGRNRVALGLRAAALFGTEILIMDDGFQHHRLHRDVDLVCVDAGLGLGNGHVLPRGPLREAASALRRAGAIVWTRLLNAEAALPDPPVQLPVEARCFGVEIRVRGIRQLGASGLESSESLRGRKVGLLAAIARPDRLASELRELGAEIAARRTFADHHSYRRSDLAGLDPGLLWVTTEKDAVKIPAAWSLRAQLVVLEEEVRPRGGGDLIEFILERVRPAVSGGSI